ncbi:type VI secretion system baseplate subunit TssE [Candidatus Odyssella thessalonicensis]|uniref:type VI secretion system baseplate subunit TssE n=1 Tax=Candidatus Odyssella thessalonicensis TaxID=84647 RepID=UPI000225B711|nr:type VI secretion system baseplate subunit TssE [Candidatus Odyssella thessalonicensis]
MFNRNIIEESFAEPKRKRGAPVPLFEKLIDEDRNNSDEIPPLRFYNQFELMQSIQRELGRILNTRANATKAEYDQLSIDKWNFALPQMYGLADFSQYDATNEGHHPHIALLCENAIRLFEPRLKNPSVTIIEFDNKKFCLLINITATLNIKDFQDEVTFPLEIQA